VSARESAPTGARRSTQNARSKRHPRRPSATDGITSSAEAGRTAREDFRQSSEISDGLLTQGDEAVVFAHPHESLVDALTEKSEHRGDGGFGHAGRLARLLLQSLFKSFPGLGCRS